MYTLLYHSKAALSKDFVPLNLIVLKQLAFSVLYNKVTFANLHLIFVIDRVLFHYRLEFLKNMRSSSFLPFQGETLDVVRLAIP